MGMPRNEILNIDGHEMMLWHPFPSDHYHAYSISDGGGWINGLFDSRESAIEGFRLTFKQDGRELLSQISKKINPDRAITLEDLA